MAAAHTCRWVPWCVLGLALTAAGAGCERAPRDLLEGLAPSGAEGVSHAEVVSDGRVPPEGDDWGGPGAARLAGSSARIDWDLGGALPIGGAYLQGDNNDEYVVSGSEDGVAFRELWVAPPVAEPGLRGRTSGALSGRARFIRLTARGGDGHYSVSELRLFSASPGLFGLPGTRLSPEVAGGRFRTALLYLLLVAGALLFGIRVGTPAKRVLALGIALGAAVLASLWAAAAAWPLGGREVSFARAVAAALGLLALGRAAWRRWPARPAVVLTVAATGAVLAFACFYNLGRPQFWNAARARPMFVHVLDMRIYQPFAKYYGELRYDGVYLASVLAYAEDERGGSLDALAAVEVRDQRDYRMHRVGELGPQIREVRARFSDARWAEFKRDLSFFREALGPSFLTTLDDHGANAPPVWVFFARLLVGHVTASETSLTVAGFVDGLLLLLMAVVLARCFGLLPMLASMTVFGATELYMFGSNWTGATLRHDWIVLVALGACAIKARRPALGGAALGLATMLRLLPGVALVGVALVPAAWYAEQWRRSVGNPRRVPEPSRDDSAGQSPAPSTRFGRPSRAAFFAHEDNRAPLWVLVGAGVTIVVAFLITGALYSFSAWAEWWDKVRRLNDDLAVNEVDLRALLAGTDATAADLLRTRWPIFVAVQLAGVGIVVAAARHRPLEEAMLLALPLMLLLANPVNYHDQIVFLLPLVALRGGLLASAAPLLAMCVADYQAALDPDPGRRFQTLTVLLFAALAWYYALVLRDKPGRSR